MPLYAYLTVGIPHGNYSMQLPPGTHFLYCLHLFASSIIECSWSRNNSNWKVNTANLHRWLTETVSQCVWRLAFETFTNTKRCWNITQPEYLFKEYGTSVRNTGSPGRYFKKALIISDPVLPYFQQAHLGMVWSELAHVGNSCISYESNMIAKQRNLAIHSKKNKMTKERGQKWSTFSFLGSFLFLLGFFFTSALVVFYHKRHRKPQKILLK